MTESLPVDAVIPELCAALEHHPAAVLQAPPGAGKTTRIPLVLLNQSWLAGKSIVMLEPRRLAAANAARWMASTLGEDAGETVGYAIRFERRVSNKTRVEVVTEGILTRRIQNDPLLEGVGLVIFDEFHERNLNSDLALSLCLDAQRGLRPDLKILVMSATLDCAPVAGLLGNAPIVSSEGRSFPVDIRYEERDPEGKLPVMVASAVKRALSETEGDILAFLPGVGEIRRCKEILDEALAHSPSPPLVLPLHADLPFRDQERAILPAARRKVVLATTIAETSLTIDGVRVVVDSGWSRQPRYDAASGLDRLVTVRVSRASADQRAGRAGRQGPGVCYRLWSRHVQQGLVPFTPPEIKTTDLSRLVLELACWGVSDPYALAWLDPPPAAAWQEGAALLVRLCALDPKGMITALGREMADLPTHPRLARLLVEAHREHASALGCDIAALLGERDIFGRDGREGRREGTASDLIDRLEALEAWRRNGTTAMFPGIDRGGCAAVERAATYWRRQLHVNKGSVSHDPVLIGRLLAVAWPDRIAFAREAGDGGYLLANGKGARLSPRSAVHNEPCIVAVVVEGGGQGDGKIHLASALDLATFRSLFVRQIESVRSVSWDRGAGRVVARLEERFGALVLESKPASPSPEESVMALIQGLREWQGLGVLNWTRDALQFRARVAFMSRAFSNEGWPDLSDSKLLETLSDWLGPHLAGVRSLAQLASLDLLPPIKDMLTWEQQRRLEEGAPTHLSVPSGSRIRLEYSLDGPPVLAVKLQEMFGQADTPRVAFGRVPVMIHLLSPAQRPIQVTQDLKSFWNNVYPQVKKELKGRYPRHPWPDDPWEALPTRRTKPRPT